MLDSKSRVVERVQSVARSSHGPLEVLTRHLVDIHPFGYLYSKTARISEQNFVVCDPDKPEPLQRLPPLFQGIGYVLEASGSVT